MEQVARDVMATAAEVKEGEDTPMGLALLNEARILLLADLPLSVGWATLHHEAFHFILAEAGLPYHGARAERLCDAYAAARVFEMQYAPRLRRKA